MLSSDSVAGGSALLFWSKVAGNAGFFAAVLAVSALPASAQSKPKIGMIGSGRQGGALGVLFAKAGYPVLFSSRHPEELKDIAKGEGSLKDKAKDAAAAVKEPGAPGAEEKKPAE